MDTSETQCSVALEVNGRVFERLETEGRRHSEFLLPAIDDLLQAASVSLHALNGLVFTCGPGAFTGLRIGLAAVQGLSFGAGLTMYPVSTLLSLAYQGVTQLGCSKVLAVMDARMDQVYLAGYEFNERGVTPLIPEQVCCPRQLALQDVHAWLQVDESWACVGSGSGYYPVLSEQLGEASCVQAGIVGHEASLSGARAVLQCATQLDGATTAVSSGQVVDPVYLRNNVAQAKAR